MGLLFASIVRGWFSTTMWVAVPWSSSFNILEENSVDWNKGSGFLLRQHSRTGKNGGCFICALLGRTCINVSASRKCMPQWLAHNSKVLLELISGSSLIPPYSCTSTSLLDLLAAGSWGWKASPQKFREQETANFTCRGAHYDFCCFLVKAEIF